MKWPMVTLDTVLASLEAGSRPRGGTKDVKDGVPSLGGEHLNNNGGFNFTSLKYIPEEHFAIMRKGIIRLHDILMVKDGATTGKTSFVRDDFPFEHAAVNEHVFIVRVRPEIIHPAFAFYFLFSKRGQAEIHKDFRGATIGGISRQFPKKVNIPLPPLSEQRRIVEILDQADALRKKRAEADAKAARILPALFYEMFGDPATNPKGLPKTSIRNIVIRVDRRNPSDRPEEYFTYIDIAGVDGETGEIVETKRLIGSDAPSRARQILKAKDVLVSTVRPYLRATALVPDELDNQICSTGFCVLRPKEGFGYGFLYAMSRLPWFTEQLNMRARGASYPAVTDADILNLEIPRSTNEAQIKLFDQWVDGVIDLQRGRRVICQRLETLFAVLLHRAFTGDLTARWREAHMEELLEEM